jgi:hypothetical protein
MALYLINDEGKKGSHGGHGGHGGLTSSASSWGMRGSSLWVRSRKGRLRTGCVVFKEAKRSADTLHTYARALHTFASYLVKLKLLRGDISQNLTSQNVLPSGARTGSRARRCRGSSLSRRTHRSPHTLLRIAAALGHCTSGPLDCQSAQESADGHSSRLPLHAEAGCDHGHQTRRASPDHTLREEYRSSPSPIS